MIEFMDPKYDTAFKKLFGANNHKNVTMAFLNTILEYKGDERIVSVEFANNERGALIVGYKETILDIYCIDAAGRHFIIEMQNAKQSAFEKRLETYITKTHAEQLKDGFSYAKVQPVILVAITKKFSVFPDKKSYKSIHVMLDKHTHEHNFKGLTIALIELPKFKKKESELKTDEDRWLYLLKYITKHHEMPTALNQAEFADACKVLNKMTWSAKELAVYEKDMLDEQAAEAMQQENAQLIENAKKSRDEGKAEGKAEAMRELAKKMLLKKKPIAEIVDMTELSVDEIEKL